jgi:outer membrane protein insertion porin family
VPRTPPLSFCALVAAVLSGLGPSAGAQSEPGPARIAGFEIHGGVDPPERLQALVRELVPPGSPLLPSGELDREGAPVSTEARLRRAFDRIGYDAAVKAIALPGGREVRLDIQLRAYDRIRQILVSGNWRVRQEEIIQQISLRLGQPLPVPGPDRDARIELQRTRVLDYLRTQGYLEARVAIELHGTSAVPSPINLRVRIDLGPGYPIGPISVRGNRALPSAEIAELFRHRSFTTLWIIPEPFKRSTLLEDVKTLTERYRKLGYAAVRITHVATPDARAKQVRLQIDITERKRVEVAFEGNRRVSDDTLRNKVTVFSRGGYGEFEVEASCEAIAQYYREEKGNMLVRVSSRRQRLSPDADRLIFIIDEGPVLKVRGVDFVGQRSFSTGTLSGLVNVKTYPFLGLGGGGYATLRQLAVDVDNLALHYQNAGFLQAKVRCEIAPRRGAWRPLGPIMPQTEGEWRAASALYVRFVIEEGVLVRIADIRFELAPGDSGPMPRDDRYLRDLLLSVVGGPFQRKLVREDGDRLKRYLGDLGYPEAAAEAIANPENGWATIIWQIKLGPRVQVGPVFVRGNFLTREKTILSWVPLRTGSPLTTTALERGQRNLALIQLFNNPSPISFPAEGTNDPVVPMLIEVEERHDHFGVVKIGGGASTEQVTPGSSFPVGFYAALGYEHRNLFGRGWTVISQANYGQSLVRGTASFVDPRFFGTLFRLELGASYLSQATVRLGAIRSGAGFIGLAREMYPGIDASFRYNLRDTVRSEFLLRGAGPFEDQQTVQIGTVVGSLSLTVDWLRLDNPLVPTRGFKLSAGVEMAQPALSLDHGQDRFVKVIGRSLSVVPLTRLLSLRHSLRYDQGLPFGSPLLPKVERFFAGGDTTIRGFELDRARTEIIRSNLSAGNDAVRYRPVGGSLRVLSNVDLQFPIAPPWYGAVFFDSGVVADSLVGLGAADFRHGVGISPFQLKLPIGDISVSWAWPLDPQPGDARIGRLHVNVGLMF